MDKEWIPAFAAEHPSEAPLSTPLALKRNAQGGMTEREGMTDAINGKRPCDYRCER